MKYSCLRYSYPRWSLFFAQIVSRYVFNGDTFTVYDGAYYMFLLDVE